MPLEANKSHYCPLRSTFLVLQAFPHTERIRMQPVLRRHPCNRRALITSICDSIAIIIGSLMAVMVTHWAHPLAQPSELQYSSRRQTKTLLQREVEGRVGNVGKSMEWTTGSPGVHNANGRRPAPDTLINPLPVYSLSTPCPKHRMTLEKRNQMIKRVIKGFEL